MATSLRTASLLLAAASLATAQFGGPPSSGGPGSGGYNPYSGSGNGGNGNFGGPGEGEFGPGFDVNKMVAAHAILATVAFGLLFPAGSILIRLGSFRGLWLVHGIFQLLTYVLYFAAFGIGIWMATHLRLLSNAHPVIGMFVLVFLFFQPFLGFLHHFAFKKHSRRVFWSYAHIWLGRIVITAGIINGGLGLRLSTQIGRFAPKQSTIIAYGVVAGVIWLVWMACAIYGENKRRKANYAAVGQAPPPYKRETGSAEDGVRYA